METIVELAVSPRSEKGTVLSRRMRHAGHIPAVVYQGRESQILSVNADQFEKLMRSRPKISGSMVLNLQVENSKKPLLVLLKSMDKEIVGDKIVHIDFQIIEKDKEVTAKVPVQAVGKPRGEVRGGLLQTVRRLVLVKCLPAAIPLFIEVDVSGLDVEQSFHVKDLVLPAGVVAASNPEATLYSVKTSRNVIDEEATAGEGEQQAATTAA